MLLAVVWSAVQPQKEVEVEVELRQSVGQSVLVSGAHLGPVAPFSFSLKFSFRQLRVFCYFVAPSLTRGRVCNLLYSCFCVIEVGVLKLDSAEK
jgi:hypothetical protein